MRLFFEWCAISAITLSVIVILLTRDASDRLDNVLYDGLVSLAAPPVSDRILLVTIDDTSLAQIGHWPWPRGVHAKLLERLAAAHPAAVAYDVLFTEATTEEQDQHLGQALRVSGNVALPVLFQSPGSNGRAIDAIPPVEPIAGAARAIGQVVLVPDGEGVGRSVLLSLAAGGRDWPHLMEATYHIATGHASPVYRRLATTGQSPLVVIPFQPSAEVFRTVSFASVLTGEVPEQFIRDRIVLVGVNAAGLGDRFRVPTRSNALMSGVEVQANLLNGLLADWIITVPSMAVRLATAVMPALTLLLSFWYFRPARAFAVSIVAIGFVLIVPPVLLLFFHTWLAPVPALAGVIVAYPLWSWRRLQAVDRTISDELDAFSGEDAPMPLPAANQPFLDPIGGQTMRLHMAIAAMRDVRRLVSDTMDSVNDPILVTDLDDFVILANTAANALFSTVLDGSRSTPLLERLAGRPIRFDEEPSEILLDNEKTYFPRRLPLRNHAGEQRGWIVHLADISAIRLAQREREDALEFLSHDMRSPQSSIITLLEQHRNSIGDGALAERIKGLARKTLRLSDDFVQLARLSVASFDADEVNLADVLIEAADELWPLASRSNVRIAVAGAEDPFYMLGERDALSRALVNLIDNAVKFSPEGATVQCSIRFAGNGTIECLIEDEGPGIPAERRRDLFARYGARHSAAGSRVSAGLGLAFVGAAVKRHGGSIVCEPREPHGTRFVLRFTANE